MPADGGGLRDSRPPVGEIGTTAENHGVVVATIFAAEVTWLVRC